MARAILRIRSVQLVGPFSLRLGFSDGTSRRINLQSELTGPVFEPLQDAEVFSRVVLDPVAGTVAWPNGADFAPEFLRGLPRERTKPATKGVGLVVPRLAAERRSTTMSRARKCIDAVEMTRTIRDRISAEIEHDRGGGDRMAGIAEAQRPVPGEAPGSRSTGRPA